MRPEFGCAIHDCVFAPGDAATAGRIAVRGARRRSTAGSRASRCDDVDGQPTRPTRARCYIDVRYSIRGTNDPRNLVFPFYVIPPRRAGPGPGRAPLKRRSMALPAPNLDDRRFQELVDDAKRYVQQRCPEWTDHNVSDPGVTLIETFAYMVDQLLYRLNRVPDRQLPDVPRPDRHHAVPAGRGARRVTFWLSAPQAETGRAAGRH